jgi:hypothetical protein
VTANSTPAPTASQSTVSTGLAARFVTVTQISSDGQTAICVDRTQAEVRVPIGWQRAKGLLPAVGENWVLSQDLTNSWTFALCMSAYNPTPVPAYALAAYVYDGTPALGNPPVEWMSGATEDPFGNALPTQGVASGAAGSWVSLSGGQVSFSNGGFVGQNGTAIIFGGVPVEFLDPIASTLNAVKPGTTATAETWHTASLVNSWTGAGSGTNGLFYKLTVTGEVRVIGDVTSPGTASLMTTLQAGYRPATSVNIAFSRYDDAGQAHALLGTDGTLTMQTTVGSGKGMFCNASIPLGTL